MWFLVICVSLFIVVKLAADLYRPKNFPPGKPITQVVAKTREKQSAVEDITEETRSVINLIVSGPRGLPLIGNILDLKRAVNETSSHGRAFLHLAKKYGSVVALRMGLADPLIVVSGREAVLEMLRRHEFDGRPNGFVFTHRTRGEKRGVLFTDGNAWNDQRRFSVRNLKVFGWHGQSMEEMLLDDAVNLTKIIERARKDGPIKDMDLHTSLAVINSLWSIVQGSRYDLENGDPKIIETLHLMHQAVKKSNVTGGILNQLPFLRYIAPKFTGFEELNKRLDQTWHFFADEVTRHKQSRKSGTNRDLIDVYLQEIETRKNDPTSSFNEMQLVALLKDLFAAGIDTTSNSIGFAIAYLTVHPEVQDKVQAELDRVIGRENLPSLASKNSLPYLKATLKEVLRLANIGPTTIPHRATVDTTLMGYEIKKNYTLLPMLMSVHMDQEHWGDPEAFRPERFINDNGEFVNDPWVMPFGAGRRKCLGETLAKNSYFLFVVCLLQKFRFELPPGREVPSMIAVDGFTQSPPQFEIVVTHR